MRKEECYILGTPAEIAEDYAGKVRLSRENRHIPKFDFVLVDEIGDRTLGEACQDEEYWFGIKTIKTGFDNIGVDLFCDYYGGGSGSYVHLEEENPEELLVKVEKMITETLVKWGISPNSIKETQLIGEYIGGSYEV